MTTCMAQLDANSGSAASVAHSCVIDMPQLDASNRSATPAAADDHRHVIDMGQLDTNGRNAAAAADHIDAGDSGSIGSDDVPSCVVCMEPLEWVAIGPIGQRVVCSDCSAPVRSGTNPDHRCCICRTICLTVIVTKAAAADTDAEVTFPMLPAAPAKDGRVGEYWYCVATSSYFDDEQQYEAAMDVASRRRAQYIARFLLCVLITALFGAYVGLFIADATGFPGWGTVAIVSVYPPLSR